MSGTSVIADAEMIGDAREAADDLLSLLRVPIAKALELSTPRGFDAAASRLGVELQRLATVPETEAVRRAVAELDVDWRSTTAAQRSAVLRRALTIAGRLRDVVPSRIEAPLGRAATSLVRATRSAARSRRHLVIGADLNAVDHRAIAYLPRANALFVRDEYGRRADALGVQVRGVVARGLEAGLGREDIAAHVASVARAALVGRAQSYWDVVAASFIGEARSLSQVSSYAEAGIERYVLLAVLDEHTTNTCRFLDGKVLQTADALRTFKRLEASADPIAIKRERPWVRERDGETGRELVTGDTVLAVVERSGMGVRDDRGTYSSGAPSHDLAPAGIGFPPFHGFCRTTTVPDV